MFRRHFSAILCVIMIISLTACKQTPQSTNSVTTTNISFSESQTEPLTSAVTEINTTAEVSTTSEMTTIESTTIWSPDAAEIIEMYKKAANTSANAVKSTQKISLKDFSLNNGNDAVNNVFKFIKPIISKVVESNSTEFDGITGGYNNLVLSDIKNATAYVKNDNTVIKLEMNEQHDSANANINSGSVGHAISVIGDLSVVFNQLSDSGIPIKITDDNISMTYTDAIVNVTVDNNHSIVNGTWKYSVIISLADFTVGNSTVGDASVEIINEITYNGGFTE